MRDIYMKLRLLAILLFFIASTVTATEFKFLEDMEYSVDLIKYAGQNYETVEGTDDVFIYPTPLDSLNKAWYYMGANSSIEVDFFHYGNFSLYFQYAVNLGMGQSAGNVVFDPMFSSYGINPWIEYRFGDYIAQGGIDHYCFHEIDRLDLDVTLWNKPFLAIGSANKRNSKYKETVLRRKTLKWNGWGFDSWKIKDRFSWFVKFGYFAKTVMGMGAPFEVNYNNPKVWETETDLRFAIAEYKKTVFTVYTNTYFGYYDHEYHNREYDGKQWEYNYKFDQMWNGETGVTNDKGMYYSTKLGAEILLLQGKHGFTLFGNYTFDDLPMYTKGYKRFSKDGLIEFGFRFYN